VPGLPSHHPVPGTQSTGTGGGGDRGRDEVKEEGREERDREREEKLVNGEKIIFNATVK
jgi:hypothetical protein